MQRDSDMIGLARLLTIISTFSFRHVALNLIPRETDRYTDGLFTVKPCTKSNLCVYGEK